MNILILLPDNVEEIEFTTPVDIWRRAGYNAVSASISGDLAVRGQQGINIIADILLKDAELAKFDCLFLPGGSGHKLLKDSTLTSDAVEYFLTQGKIIAAICAAPTVIAKWLTDKKATCYPSLKDQIPNYTDQKVVVDMPFITSQGAGTASDLAFSLIEIRDGKEKASELKKTMLFG